MTTADPSVAELREKSARISPGYVISTGIAWVFVGFGWTLGAIWRLAVLIALVLWYKVIELLALSVRYGVLRGYGLTEEQIEARAQARAAAKAASKTPPAPPRPSKL